VIVGSALEALTIVAGFDDVGENGYGGAAFHTHGSPQRLDVDSFFTGTSLLSMELPPNLRPARKGSTRTHSRHNPISSGEMMMGHQWITPGRSTQTKLM
jgi:hypothetical protein